ncbi:class I adenylate-forming enzyme family protein [Diaminobutyricimonas sp. TR449]|uniref:class I adenylate-forming enzyme family protein n=1 Tax=Diaminobutyricimonas sp. TR449 TaxID=2708076 RepID=UPI00141EBE99|nr:class I adenylate-forming enzyme family protein [Diaminobutyricimonas sp. TR449]
MSGVAWGSDIQTVQVGTRAFRMYRQRPHSLGSILQFADRWGDRPHIVQGERTMSFADLRQAVNVRARDLVNRGVRPGDRVVLLGWNSPEWVVNFWATTLVRGVAVLGNAWWSPVELTETLDRIDPALVLAEDRLADRLGGKYTLAPWMVDSAQVPAVKLPSDGDENDDAVVIFTSGTSGRPKAALLSHRSLLSGLQMLMHITKRFPDQVLDTTGEAALHTGPMFHVGGVQTLLRSVCVGDTLVMPAGKFDPADALRLIEEWKIRRWSAVPTMLSRVIEHPDAQTRDLSTLRSLTVGGAAAHPELLERIRTGLPGVEPRIATGFGLTENGGQGFAASGMDTVSRPGSTGRALPCVEVRIGASHDGADGEILLRSPTQMTEYIGEDENPITVDGWLHTGDLGKLDEDGYLWITGRSKDMIIRGGENIAPAAVERALLRLPEVEDAVVFSVPDADLGEDVAAAVVTAAADPAGLRAQLQGALASFALPNHWVVQSEPFPLNHAGKVERASVIADALGRLTEPAFADQSVIR